MTANCFCCAAFRTQRESPRAAVKRQAACSWVRASRKDERFSSERWMVLYLFEVYLLAASAVVVVALALWVSVYVAFLGIGGTIRFLKVRYPQRMAGNFWKLAEL